MIAGSTGLFLLAASCSALGGLLGMASGIFIVPALTLLCQLDVRSAIGAGLVSVVACSCASAGPLLRAGLADLRLALLLETATTGGALGGLLLFGRIPQRVLLVLFAAVLLVSAWQMARPRLGAAVEAASPSRRRLSFGMVLMFAAGLLSSLLGVGSGVLKIPAMDAALRLPIRISSATSNVMIGVTASAGAASALLAGRVGPALAGPVVLGSIAGALLGARLLLLLDTRRLRAGFVLVLLLLAVRMGWAAWHGTPGAAGG